MSDNLKTVRFKESEWKLIEEFLELNPFFDFSTLARQSILGFIREPKLELHSVEKNQSKAKGKRRVRHG